MTSQDITNPARLQILWSRLLSIADEMAVTLKRTAFSPIVRDAHDYGCAVFDADANMVAMANDATPGLSVSSMISVRNMLQVYPPETLQQASGERRSRYMKMLYEMIQMISHGAATGEKVELDKDNAAMVAAGVKTRHLHDAADMQAIIKTMRQALTQFPEDAGVDKEDIMKLATTALTWTNAEQSGNENDRVFKPVEGLGRVTSAAQLPTTPGHTFSWQVVWDTANGTLVTIPLELPSSVPRGLYDHMSCTLMASCVGMDGKKYTHMKSLHADDKPDISGVWGTMNVPLVLGGPVLARSEGAQGCCQQPEGHGQETYGEARAP